MTNLPRRLRSITPVLLTALLASCGGGSDNDTAPAPPAPPPGPVQPGPPPPVQPAPFAVASTTTNAARDAGFSATFNAPVDPATVDHSAVQLTTPEGLLIPATVTVNGSTVNVMPREGKLPGGTTYTAKLPAAIKSTSGQALAAALTTPFTTAAQRWEPEVDRVDISMGSPLNPTLAVAADGTVTAILHYRSAFGPAGGTVARTLAPGSSTWSAAVDVPIDGYTVGIEQVVTARNGNIYVPYTRYLTKWGPESAEIAVYNAASGKWAAQKFPQIPGESASSEAPNVVNDNATVTVPAVATSNPKVSIDRLGNATAIFMSSKGAYMSRQAAGSSTWTLLRPLPFQIYENSYATRSQDVDKDGKVHLAWHSSGEVNSMSTSTYDPASDTWSVPVVVDTNSTRGPIQLWIDEQGSATMIWESRMPGEQGGTYVAAVRRAPGSTAWSAVAQLTEPGSEKFPQLWVSPAGAATVVYRENNKIMAVRSAPGTLTWDRAGAQTVLPDTIRPGDARLSGDRAGNLTLLYRSNSVSVVHYSAHTGTWNTTSSPLPTVTNADGKPVDNSRYDYVAQPNGDITFVWSERDEARQRSYLGAVRYR